MFQVVNLNMSYLFGAQSVELYFIDLIACLKLNITPFSVFFTYQNGFSIVFQQFTSCYYWQEQETVVSLIIVQ